MTAISQTPIQPGSFKYGRSIFLVWDVVPVDDGYEYQYAEVPLHASNEDTLSLLYTEGISPEKAIEILNTAGVEAVVWDPTWEYPEASEQ